MKINLLLLAVVSLFLTSCATIVGGSKYNARIIVTDRPTAKIYYRGQEQGTGAAAIKVKRNEANQFSFTVREEGCQEQTFNFVSRRFRGWALAGTLVTWTGVISGIPVPWGLVVDLATGALWKPDTMERGVFKEDHKNYLYQVSYSNCKQTRSEEKRVLLDIVYLKNGSIIKGVIIEQVPNVSLKIETRDGSIFVYKFEEIEKIAREQDN
jgi:hypothetical protein